MAIKSRAPRRLLVVPWWMLVWMCCFLSCHVVGGNLFSPQDVPGPPEKVLVSSLGDSAMRVQFLPPVRTKSEGNNGAPVLGYKVEVARRVNDVHTFTVEANGPVTAGSYRLTFTNSKGTDVTACIPWNATEIMFELALEELVNVDTVSVSRSANGVAKYGYVYTIVFSGKYLVSGQQTNVLVADQTGCQATRPLNRVLTLTGARTTAGAQGYIPEVWEIVTEDPTGANVIGGSFDLSLGFDGSWADSGITATIAAGSRTAVTSAPIVGRVNRGDAIRIGGEEFTVHMTAPFTDFSLPLDTYHIRGVSGAAIYLRDTALGDVAVTQGSQTVTTASDFRPYITIGEYIKIGKWEFKVTAVPTATSLTIGKIATTGNDNWPDASVQHITAYKRKKVTLSANAEATDVKLALNGLPGIGVVDVSRVGPTRENGYRWRVTFLSLGTKNNCPVAPCLYADKVTGTNTRLTDAYGSACATCAVTASLIVDDSNNQLIGVAGEFLTTSVVATREIGGIVDEVQQLSTSATADNIGGTFKVNFWNPVAQSDSAIINFDDTAVDVQTKLQNIPTVGRLNVTRTGNDQFGYTWMVTFLTNVGDLPLLQLDATSLTGAGAAVSVQEVQKGVDAPFEATIDGLFAGQDYYIRAFAKNVNGYGAGTDLIQREGKGALPLATRIAGTPDTTSITGAWPLSGTQLGVRFTTPEAHGSPITKYVFEYAVGNTFGVFPIKKFFILNPIENDLVGTFRLQYGDVTTPLLSIHTSASAFAAAISQLPSLRPVTVSRAAYVLTGTTATNRVKSFLANKNLLSTSPLSLTQSKMLVSGATVRVGGDTFTVKTQPATGATTVEVMPGHGVADYTADRSMIKVDPTGAELGPCGYEWTISFRNELEAVTDGGYPGFQVLSTLRSVEAGATISTFGFSDQQVAQPVTYYGAFDISNDDRVCDTYVVGAPSAVQILQLYASTTITGGGFQLQLGQETTACITLGTLATKSTIQTALRALNYVDRVSVEEHRAFKVLLLSGSSTSKVTVYVSAQSKITVTALGAQDAAALGVGTLIQVGRNPNDFTRHSCEFRVTAAAASGDTEIAVAVSTGTCADFAAESRALRILDFHDYKIRFWGQYPTGQWPTLKVVSGAFGVAPCLVWAPAVPVYSSIHTLKYEGVCANGRRGTQTILADASSDIGGFFTLSYLGEETSALGFQTTTAATMRSAIDSITEPGKVNVTLTQYGAYGKAWRITFMSDGENEDMLFIKHSYLTGEDAVISVYPTIEIMSNAQRNDIRGTFRLTFAGQRTERIAYTATHAKVVQELQKLGAVDSVIALGSDGDMGVTSLLLTATATAGSALLTNIQLNGKTIDPTLFLAVREKLTIAGTPASVRSLTPTTITLKDNLVAGGAVTINAGLITKRIKPLPGVVSINRLMRVVTATKTSTTFELPPDHGYNPLDVFYMNGAKFTVQTVNAAIVTTAETYTGDNIVGASPEVYLFDNKLRTTSDVSSLLAVNDDIWLQTTTGEMTKYTVSGTVTSRVIPVTGVFVDTIIGAKVYQVGYGRSWSLVFRSYVGKLESIDAIPQNDWRGTEARLTVRHPNAVAKHTFSVGNSPARQTVLLEATTAAAVGAGATYTLTFGDETTSNIPWTATGDAIKTALEALDSIDGVTITSMTHDNGFLHTVVFWGMYTTPRLPTLVGTVIAATDATKCSVLVRDSQGGAVSETKRDHLILKSNEDFVFRLFAVNEKGISDLSSAYSTQTTTMSVIPTPPTSVSLGEYQGSTWLTVHYRPPVYTGGAEITMYRLEWDSSPTFDSVSADYGVASIQKKFEVQQVLTTYRSDTNMGGTFTLAWGGRMTTSLPFDCSADQMTDALAIITDTANIAVNPVKVVRTRASWGYSWQITFLNNPGDLALLVADGSLLTGDFPRITVSEVVKGFSDLAIGDFTHEVQEIYSDAKTTLSGTFTLEFEGRITTAISVGASALEMQDALQAITTLYSIKVTRTWRSQAINTAIWTVTFAYLRGEEMVGAGNIFNIKVADTSLLGGTAATVKVANKITGSDPFRYTITGLRPGLRYYFHVMAYNAEGFGSTNSPMSSAVTCGQPDPPKSMVASVVDGTSLGVTWTASAYDGGCPIDRYKVEWYRVEGTREQQTITTSASKGLPEIQSVTNFADSQSLGGYFKLSFGGETSENIAWNAPATGQGSIKERLERLSSVGTVDVSQQPSTRVVGGLMVTVTGTTVTVDASSTSTIGTSSLGVNDFIWILGTQLKITASTATTFTVDKSISVPTTVAVPVFRKAYGFQWLITFQAGHVGPQELLKVTPSDNWAGNNPGIYVDSVQKGLQPISGTFRVSFASGGLSHITPPLPHNVTSDGLKDALESLVTIGTVDVMRSTNGFGFNWLVTFTSEFKNEISLLGVDDTELHGPSVRISAARTRTGVQPVGYCEFSGVAGAPAVVQMPAALGYTIRGLTTGQGYAIRVRARNGHGYGAAAYISPSFQTPRTTPSAPVDAKLLVLSSRQLKVRWSAPLSNGGSVITSYVVQWDTSNVFLNGDSPNYDYSAVIRVQASDTGPFFYNIAISTGGTYFARVVAVNDQGRGAYALSDPTSAIPVDRTPGQAENVKATVLSNYAILVEWDASSTQKSNYGGDGGLPITQYMVEWDSSAGFDSPASFGLVDGTKRSYIIGGNDPITGVRSNVLIPGTTYSIRVIAFNAKGAGRPKASDPPSVVAANQLPTVPRNLQLSVVSASSLKAQWDNPLYDGGASLKSYEVQWDEQGDFSSGQSKSATIPIVREMQSLTLSTDVVNEEQLIDATVEVINEVQVVRTTFTGADEIQVIQTTNNAVVDEVQTVTTSATDRDEVQELRLDGDDVNEIQAIRTTVAEVFEVQTLQVGVVRVNEIQTISLTIPGAQADATLITGHWYLSFDNTICTHCTKAVGYRRTTDLISSLTTIGDAAAALVVENALKALDNIDTVSVARSKPPNNGMDLTYIYTVTFTGDGVTGDVPELVVDSTFGEFPPAATQATRGNEVAFDPASQFGITHTCESYSDPYAISTFSAACTPSIAAQLCASCITRFDGTVFTIATGTTLAATVAINDRLIAGICVFTVGAVSATSLTVLANDVGLLCSTFTGATLPLFRAVQPTTMIPVKTAPNTISAGSVVENLLNTIIDSVTVVRTQSITATFVGSLYEVTFRKRSGRVPLLRCDASTIQRTNTNGAAVCTPIATTTGSMIGGKFTISLAKESDGVVVTTPDIPWDASESLMKSTLEGEVVGGERVFGTVNVRRSVFSPTGNKWSGGFTWQIEFTSRGWDIPKMTVTNALVNSDNTKLQPDLLVEDATSPFNPFAGSRDGNQIAGSITFAFGVVTSQPCMIGVHTDTTNLQASKTDAILAAFLVAQLGIPTIQVTRSAATQARGFTWAITFSDPATGGDVAMLDIPATLLTGQNVRTRMFETVKGNQLGGTFQLKFNGETSGPILFSADNLAVQAQLNSLASIKPSSVLVSRTGPVISSTTQVLSYTWSITFRSSVWADPTGDHSNGIAGNWKGPRAKWDDVWPETGYSKAWGRHVGPMASKGFQVMCIEDGLTTTANDNSQNCQSAVATAGVGPILGTFTVTLNSAVAGFMSVKKTVVSTPIAHNAWATRAESGATGTSVEEILEEMENIGDVAVSRSAVNTQTGGYTWTVTFLRDANGPCEQEEPSTSGVRLCNSPGDVPAMTASLGTLAGSTPTVTVCEKTLNNCLLGAVQNGRILRGDFTTFKVTGDPGFDQRYFVTIACAGGAAPPCDPIQFFNIALGSEDLPDHLKTKDRFTIDGYPTCIYTVVRVTATQVEVNPSVSCPAMVAGMANNPVSVFIRVPWNADESLVKRVLEASSDQNNEMVDPWKGGRKVSVVRTIFGKYGEVSWQVRFISNPTFTPPGAGNIRDITTVFAPNPTTPDLVSVTQVTPGSAGLSGSFLVDFHSTFGPREIMFDESEDRLQRKLNEMNTVGRVIVKKFQYPSTTTGCTDSSCSGGWEDQPVGVPGTRGGYRWRVRFMKVTGEYGGLTFPSGSGNVGPLAVTLGTLQGNQRAIDLTTNLGGSSPIVGGFTLNTSTKATPSLPYSASADSIKQGIESMNLFGEVDVTQEYLLMQRIPNAVATISKDGITATVAGVDDIRQSLALGDRVRFGPSSAANLVGTNGDSPITGVIATSTVTVLAMSPNVRADPTATRLLFPKMNVRIDGLVYQIQHSGHEIQTVAVTLPIGSWDPNEARTYFNLKLKRGGSSQTTTACWPFDIDAATVQRDLNALLVLLIPTAQANEIKVTRSGPMSTEANARKGYIFSVYFLGPSVAGNVAILEADFTGCTAITGAQVAIAVTTQGGKIGHQRLSFATDSGQVVDPTGYFKLSLGGASTGCLKWGISASDLEAQLEGTLNTGNVLVARRGSGASVTEVQRLRMTSNSQVTTTNTGLFQLAFTVGGKTSWTTGCLAYGISAEELQVAINQMSNIAAAVSHVAVTRDGDGTSVWGYGYEYTINFRGPIAGGYSNLLGNVAQLEVFNVGSSPCAPVVGGAPALIMETVRDGRPGYTYDIYFLNYAAAYTPQLSIQHEGNGGVCTTGWTHTGGSVREANVDVVSLGGSSEVQTLVFKDSAAQIPAGSSYKLTFGGASTNCIVFDASASALETALVGLATIATGGVLVSRDQHPVTAPNGYIYAITFIGELTTGDVPLLATVLNDPLCQAFAVTTQVVVTEQVKGGAHPGGFVTTALYDGEQPGQHVAYAVSQVFSVLNEQIDIQQLLVTNPQSDLTVNSVYKLVVLGVTTVSIRWDASEDDMETALTVAGVNDGDIVVTRRKDAALAPNGYVYSIYFSGNTVKGIVAAITVNTKTSFGSGDVLVSTVQNGVDNAPSFLTTSIPLALPSDSSTSSAYLGMDASLNVFKVNGFLWTIKFKSTIGNIPALGMRSDGLSGTFTVLDDFVPGSSSNSYVMSSLYPGINYFVRVAASTDIGTGPLTDPASKIPSGVATAVQNIAAGYALYVREVQEIRVAATHINEIQEIKTSAATMAEVQTVRTYASADACTDGNCIGGLFAFRVPTVQTIKVSAQGPITAGSYSIRFVRYKSNGAGAFVADGTVFDTVKISWDASADDVKMAMAALDSVDASDLIVTRDGDGSSAFGYGYILSITFIGNKVAGETDKITIKDSTSGCGTCDPFVTTGNVPYAITVSMNSGQAMGTDTAVQEVIVKASKPVVSGSYRLEFTNLGAPVQSACINFDAPARGTDVRAMEGILIAMSNIDVVYVTRDLDPVRAPNGFVYQVFFYGNGVYGPMITMEVVMCEAFKTQENNVLTTNGVNGLVTVTTIDAGGITAGNTFVDAASATADQLEADLNRLPVFGDVIVTRSLVDQQGGFVWTVAFKDSEGNLPQFICAVDATFAGRTGTACETTTLTDGNALSGTFVVESSVPIAFDASAATMKAALEAMSWIGTVQVVRAGPTPQMGFTWTITFLDYMGDVPPLLITSSLVGTGSAIQVTEITKGNFISGTFTLTYLSSTTAPIASNAKATAQDSNSDGTSLQEKLQALSIIGPTSVTRSAMDPDGGYTWLVSFLDNNLNPGDVPLLVGNATLLTGVGVVVATREIQKGSNAVGDQLWISFDPPVSDQGSPISKYVVRWDTSALFTASPSEVSITEPEKLYLVQRVMTGAPSLGWSRLKATEVAEVQTVTIANGVANGATFTLSFRGVASATLTAGVSTAADLLAALSGISTIGTVTVTPTTGLVAANAVFQVTFVDKPGDLPFLSSTPAATATITETTKGVANYRKEVIVFSCLATTGTVTFQYGAATQAIAFDATLVITKTHLETLFNVEAGGIRVLSSQSLLCAPAGPADVTIVFDRVYGDITLQITSATVGTTITRNTVASIDGIYNDVAAKMSGTFQVGYKGEYTRALNAESSALDMRYALEDLITIDTVAVSREASYQALPGTVDVVNGQIFVTCSTGQTCGFLRSAYGLPGYHIRIGGTWYRVRTSPTTQDSLDATRLYLGDTNGREIGYQGETRMGMTVYEWTKGYVWAVYMLRVAQPLAYLRAKIPRLVPSDSTVMIAGSACDKCYYLPTQTTKRLTMGQEYFIDITAYNENGKGQLPVNGPIRATPSQVPNAPSNVDFVVVSGKELEVFFSPPALASTNVSPNFNNDISSYIVQWDLRNDFKHGLPVCTACATALQVNALTVSQSLVTLLAVNSKFTIAAENCVLTVAAITATRIDVSPNHGCSQFNTGAYPLYYYTYPPAILTGDQIQGSPPFRYLISNLVVSTQYYVRVAAVNSVPVQQIALSGNPPDNRKWSFPLAATTKDTVPDPPVSVYLYPFSGTTLEIQIQPPTRDGQGLGGAAITFYWVDIDTVSTFDSATKAAPVEVDVSGPDIPVLYAGGPRVYYSKNLQTGVRYFVQVKAKNSIGYSRATIAPNPLAPTQSPDGPVNVKVATVLTSPTPIDYATVTWQKPLTDGGLPVTSYKIEWWGADSRPEIQVIEIKWTTIPTTAPFKLAFGGLQTGNMPFDVAPENLRSALMNLGPTKIQHVQVTRSTVNINKGYQWRVTFQNNLNTGDQPMIQLEFGTIVGGTDVTGRVFEAQFGIAVPQLNFPGKREVQVLLTSHATTTVGGYFRLSYKGSAWSNYLSATIAGADLKLALEALPTVGKVTVTSQGASTNGQIWTITFESAVGNLPALIVDSSKLTPAGAFIGVKDGDNAVDKTGARCVPGDDICPGSWSTYKTGIAAMATIGESAVAYQFYETIDATTLSYKVTGLVPGKTYYVAVTAKNALGLGSRIRSTPTTIIPPVQAPSPPSLVTVDVNPGVATQLKVTWSAPPSDGGGEVRMYRVEYDPSPLFRNRGYQDFWCPTAPTYAVWTVQTYRQGNTGKPIGNGYFNLLLTRQNLVLQTEPISWNAVATSAEEVGDNAPALSKVFCVDCPGCTDVCQSQPAFSFGRRELSGSLQSKLEYLSTVNQVQIVRSAAAADGGYTWTITFQDVGDDFVLAPFIPGASTLTCDDNVCNGGDYRIQTTKITNGISNPPCTGSQIIPANGALNKGQLYYVRVFSFNKIGFSLPGLAASPQKPMVVPGPPTGVTLQVLTVSELKVLFSPPDDDGGDTVVEYLVEWATNNAFTNAQSGSVVLLSGGAPYYRVISNLVKGTFYYVRVKAKNSQGYGQYQISSPTSLNPYTTPSAPTQVLMGVTSSTMLTVQWSIPDDDGGDAISGYLVQWDISAGFDSLSAEATKAKITDVTQRSYTITLLTPGTTYYVRVSAINSGGAGTPQTTTPASLVPVNTRPGKPHSLQAAPTANARELLVTWQQPRIPAHGIPCSGTQLVPLSCPIFVGLDVVYGGSSLESYLVQYSDNSDFTGFNWLGVATTSALLQGLDSGKLYYVRVLTINSEGQKSDFCGRANSGGYLCPDNLVLLDGNIVTGTLVAATPA